MPRIFQGSAGAKHDPLRARGLADQLSAGDDRLATGEIAATAPYASSRNHIPVRIRPASDDIRHLEGGSTPASVRGTAICPRCIVGVLTAWPWPVVSSPRARRLPTAGNSVVARCEQRGTLQND
jgi:hypothetical protein